MNAPTQQRIVLKYRLLLILAPALRGIPRVCGIYRPEWNDDLAIPAGLGNVGESGTGAYVWPRFAGSIGETCVYRPEARAAYLAATREPSPDISCPSAPRWQDPYRAALALAPTLPGAQQGHADVVAGVDVDVGGSRELGKRPRPKPPPPQPPNPCSRCPSGTGHTVHGSRWRCKGCGEDCGAVYPGEQSEWPAEPGDLYGLRGRGERRAAKHSRVEPCSTDGVDSGCVLRPGRSCRNPPAVRIGVAALSGEDRAVGSYSW